MSTGRPLHAPPAPRAGRPYAAAAPFLECASVEEFWRAPAGAAVFVARPRVLCWRSGGLHGCALWGRPDIDDVRCALRSLLPWPLASSPRERSILADLGELEPPREASWTVLARRLSRSAGGHRARVALVLPAGMGAGSIGLAVAGVPRCELQAFRDRREALDWLGTGGEGLARGLDLLRGREADGPSAALALRALLQRQPRLGSLDAAARALGRSRRTLQRELSQAGTSFSTELALARIATAARLLAGTDLKVAAVAYEVGCSEKYFSTLFARATGWRATEYRRRAAQGQDRL